MSWLLSLVLLAGVAQDDSPAAIVARMWSQYADRLVRQDIDGLADLYTENARLMEPNVDDFVGRTIIRERLKSTASQSVRATDLRVTPRDVAAFTGVIIDQGDYIQTVAPPSEPRRAVDLYGRYFAVWAEQPEGDWKLARLMLSPKRPPPR